MWSSDGHYEVFEPSPHGSRTARLRPDDARKAVLDLWQRDYEGCVTFLVMYGATRQDAEDAAQEAFIDAWRLTDVPDSWENVGKPRAWIRKVAIRKYRKMCCDRYPENRVRTELTETILPADSPDPSELTTQTELIRTILSRLDPETRLVMAFHIDGFRSAEIARIAGIDSQKVRDLTKKGRKVLSAELVALGELSGRAGT